MNWVDFAIIALIAWFGYAAFNAGLIREVVTIGGAIFGVALAGLFYKELATDVQVAVDDVQTAEVIAFAVIFGATVLISQLVAMFLKQASSLLALGLLDSLGGAFVGLAKAFVIIEIALIVGITFTNLGVAESIDKSTLAPIFLDVLPLLKHVLPNEFKNAVEGF